VDLEQGMFSTVKSEPQPLFSGYPNQAVAAPTKHAPCSYCLLFAFPHKCSCCPFFLLSELLVSLLSIQQQSHDNHWLFVLLHA
jgi:hypothetical protein